MVMFNTLVERFFVKVSSRILKKGIGKLSCQGLFEHFLSLSLKGMGIGTGVNIVSSGEIIAMKYVCEILSSKENLSIFDVGANIGEYTNVLANVFQNRSNIYCFEPSHITYEKLIKNTNNLTNVELFKFGLGSKNVTVPLYSNTEGSGLASIYNRRLDHFNIKMSLCEEVELKTIDSFCAEKHIDRINFLKLDVEGHELSVLHGAEKMLLGSKIDFIQFEFGGCNIDSRTFFQDFFYLLGNKYRIYRILRHGLFEIENYNERLELFIPTNYLAELK